MFCSMPISLHSSLVNLDANRGSRSLIILLGSPKLVTTFRRYSAAVCSALISSLHGIKIAAFVQSWSVTVRIESYLLRYCRNVHPTWVKFDSKDTKESGWCFEVLSTKSKKRT